MLNIGSSGEFTPYVKFNGKSGRWYRPGVEADIEIAPDLFLADLANIKTGWFLFMEGQAPQRVIDASLEHAAPSPGPNFKRGFVVNVYSRKHFEGLAELSSASLHMGNAMREVYMQFQDQRGNNPGKVPVIKCSGNEMMKDKFGNNFKPILTLEKWADRPPEMPDVSPVDDSDVWQGTMAPVRQAATHVSAPVAAPVQTVAAPPAGTNSPEF